MSVDFYSAPPTYSVPADWKLSDEDREYLTDQTWQLVLRGTDDVEEYLELFEEELDTAGVSEETSTDFFESVIDQRRKQQASWGDVPKSRLTEAFAELATIGVVAREDFTCCGTCGSAEIFDERDDSREWRGYVFYHSQDTDGIFDSRQTYLGYGAFLPAYFTEEQWVAFSDAQKDAEYERIVRDLMAEVRTVLERHDIAVEWSGDLAVRIRLDNVDYVAMMPAAS
ncbi:hypothetical protein [Gordonia sp. (in: high G+C Gram-positive bacteria)]|uniref:DUF6891 domain-containing protein n=1 Tax=Gordonia sp. (in: high G+C Gram-positive bacteria) TaxID=84139 RepID=UPI0033415F7E